MRSARNFDMKLHIAYRAHTHTHTHTHKLQRISGQMVHAMPTTRRSAPRPPTPPLSVSHTPSIAVQVCELERALSEAQMARQAAEDKVAALQAEVQALRGVRVATTSTGESADALRLHAPGLLLGEQESSDHQGVVVKIEEYDGSYECLICALSVRGMSALRCSACTTNPFHTACVKGSGFADTCPQCRRKTVVPFLSGGKERADSFDMSLPRFRRCVCVYTHTHTHTRTPARTLARSHAHARTRTRTHAYTHARTRTRTHARVHARTHARARAHANTYAHTHAYTVDVHTRIVAHTHTLHVHTHTHTHTHTHIHIQGGPVPCSI